MFVKKISMPNPAENLGYVILPYYPVASDLLKTQAILWDTTVRRSPVDPKDLKHYWKSEKRPHFSMINKHVFYNFYKHRTIHRKKHNRAVVFSCNSLPRILKYKDHRKNLPTIGKKDSFRHSLKGSANMYKISVSEFFRITTGTQLRPDTFDNSRLVMIFAPLRELQKYYEVSG